MVWSFGQTSVLLIVDSSLKEIPLPIQEAPIAVGFGVDDSTLEVVHGTEPRIALLRLSGELVRERRLPRAPGDSSRVVTALHTNRGWVWGEISAPGDFFVFQESHDGAIVLLALRRAERKHFLPDSLSALMFHLTADVSDGVIVTSLWPPYEQWRVDTAGQVSGVGSGAPELAPAPGDPRATLGEPLFVSLPTVALDSGYLQVLADMRSDRRRFRLLDAEFALRRSSEASAPVGFLATAPVRRRALATRRTNGIEVVFYRWGWVDEQSARSDR